MECLFLHWMMLPVEQGARQMRQQSVSGMLWLELFFKSFFLIEGNTLQDGFQCPYERVQIRSGGGGLV
jgi:hypothetical protein